MEVDPAILPPDYVSLAQLQDRWLRQREKETSEKPKEERACELNVNHERRLPPAQPQERRIEAEERENEPIEEKEAGENPIEEEGESWLNENRGLRLPPDYVSLAQLRERWLEKKEKEARENQEQESAGLLKIDRCDKKASYEDKGKWKEIPIEGSESGVESEKGVEIYKQKLKIEADNGGIKGVLSGENSGDGEGNVKDFKRGSGYGSERGNNYRGRFNLLKENRNGCNGSWIEKRSTGHKEGSCSLKATELEKKSDNESLEVCAGIDVSRGSKNDSDDCVVEREGVNGIKVEKETSLVVKSVKLGESGYNKSRRKGYGNRRNDNNHGAQEGSYRLKEPELEKKSDSEKSEVCSEKAPIRDRKNCGGAHIVESEGLNGKKVDKEMVLAAESVKIDENGCNKNERKGFGNWRKNKNCGAQEGSNRSKELGLEKMLDNEMSKVCGETDAIRDRKNGIDAHMDGTEGLSGKMVDKNMVLPVKTVKISECGYNKNRRKGFGNRGNDNNRGAREGSYRLKEPGLEKKSDNEKSEIDAMRDSGGGASTVESGGVNVKKVYKELALEVESVKIGETVYDKNGRKPHGNRRNNKIRGAKEGSYRWKELELENKSDSEMSEVCSVVSSIIDVSRGRNNVSDDHIAAKEGLNDKVPAKAEETIVLTAGSVRVVENRHMRCGNNNGRRFGDQQKPNVGGHRRSNETKDREMIGVVWVKKEDESGR